jgi:mRNA cleavage and polyadenylation factor CLP1 P-loop
LGYSFPYDEVLRKRLKLLDLTKWKSVMAMSSKSLREGRTVLVCGSGSTGKSTLCRALINRYLTGQTYTPNDSAPKAGVLLVDFDLDRPELTPPGLMYLAHVKRALFGPPETHLAVPRSGQNHILRMHYLGRVDTSSVSNSGMKAIRDLLHYCGTVRADFPGCPVLINSSSWLLDMDSSQASSLVSMMYLSDIVYFDSSGSLKHREVLTRSMGDNCSLCSFTSKVHRSAPASTVQWSYMQSYFHLISSQLDEPTWDRLALLSSNKKEFAYSGPDSMICAIVTLGEALALENVAQALEDSIVSVMAVKMRDTGEAQSNHSLDGIPGQLPSHLAPNVLDPFDAQRADHSHVMHITPENLPYFQEFDFEVNLPYPRWSECLGLAYITAIDPTRETIEMVTPITADTIFSQRNSGFRIALVMGRQDRQWAPGQG